VYCDTSALLKLYVAEPHSDEFNDVVEGRDDLLVSDLAVTEIVRRVQHGIVERLDAGAFHRVELTGDAHRRAEHFLLGLTETPLRAADALHLALATSARAASLASFDARMLAAARAVGLAVLARSEIAPPRR
jgi:predicted nucleic acid-binding protein